jgi:hypothetical protein
MHQHKEKAKYFILFFLNFSFRGTPEGTEYKKRSEDHNLERIKKKYVQQSNVIVKLLFFFNL